MQVWELLHSECTMGILAIVERSTERFTVFSHLIFLFDSIFFQSCFRSIPAPGASWEVFSFWLDLIPLCLADCLLGHKKADEVTRWQ